MIKPSFYLFVVATLFLSCQNESDNNNYNNLKEAFLNPPQSAKPKVYWWILNGNLDTVTAKQELKAMKEAGIGGFDFFEIGVPNQDTMIPGGPAFMSDESVELIKFAEREARKHGLTMGLNLASSWNAGGSWVKPEHAGKSLYRSIVSIDGISENKEIKLPFPEISFPKEMLIGGTDKPMIPFREDGKPEYYEEIAVLAIPVDGANTWADTSNIINVTHLLDAENDILNWEAPAGTWEIHRYVCSNSGQQLVLPSSFSAGLTIDHFDSTAVEFHLNYIIDRLKQVLGDFKHTALKSFYLASYEARGFVWTSTMVPEFKNLNGYDIIKFLPSFFDKEFFSDKINQKIDQDFKKALSELMINNLYKKAREICNQHGLKINCEAGGPGFPLYNGPAEPLKALGNLDVPRGEFWINHSRNYLATNGKDSIDILRVVKEVAAASHIYGKGVVEEEAFTSFQHWQEGPGEMKPFGDRAFCEGMNRVVFHGFSHNITGSGFPGFVYHAGTHFNNKRVWWPKAKPFIQYLSRISAVFQESDFAADVVWYYGDKIPNSATPKNNHFKVGPGYDYEVINTEILLNNLSVKDGKLVLSNGAKFSILVLESEELIHPKVLQKLKSLTKQGAVIAGEKPLGISEIKDSPLTYSEGLDRINELWGSGKIEVSASLTKKLAEMDVAPDFYYENMDFTPIDYIHYKKNNLDIYFIANLSDEWISKDFSFRQTKKTPEFWDPVNGKIFSVVNYTEKKDVITIPIKLAPYGSQLVVFVNNNLKNKDIQIKNPESENLLQTVEGSWEVRFSEGWGAPEKAIFQHLSSWTDSEIDGIKYFSGIATYTKTFQFNHINETKNQKIYLDLGKLSQVAEVWLNDTQLGITWTLPHQFEISEILKDGENKLQIELANCRANRIIGDANTGENYTNTNIKNTIVAVKGLKPGSQARVAWKDVPLVPSGLFGPVTLKMY